MRVVSTGRTGSLGRHLPATVRNLPTRLDTPINLGLEENYLNGSALIHLAGVVGESKVKADKNSHLINVTATVELARQSRDLGLARFIYVSSGHVYGAQSSVVSEASPTLAESIYASQKLEAETLLRELYDDAPSQLVIARVFSILDKDMPIESLGGVARAILTETFGPTVQSSDDVRDFSDFDGVAKSLLALAERGSREQIYNICSGLGLTVKEALTAFLESGNFRVDPKIFESGNSQYPFLVGSNKRFKQEFADVRTTWKYLKDQ